MGQLFGGRSYTSPSSTGNEVFNMPGAISANSNSNSPKKKAAKVSSSWARPPPFQTSARSNLSSSKTWVFLFFFVFFHIVLQFQWLRGWERLLFWFEKSIAITGKTGRKTRAKRKRGSYRCPSDPACRLSSPLIALLISSPLSVDLGQKSSSAGADWRLLLHELSHAAFFCLFDPSGPS